MTSIPNPLSHRSDKLWPMVAGASAAAAAVAVRAAAISSWRKVQGEDPPRDPTSSDTSWGTALAWTAVIGLAAGLARLIARRGAAAAWKKATGHQPPV